MAKAGDIKLKIDLDGDAVARVADGLAQQALERSAEQLFAPLHLELGELERHLLALKRALGPAATAQAQELLSGAIITAHAAERAVRTQLGALKRERSDLAARLDDEETDHGITLGHLRGAVEELERRNKKSHAKTSPALAKARRRLDALGQGE